MSISKYPEYLSNHKSQRRKEANPIAQVNKMVA